jgi:hypothetical protein
MAAGTPNINSNQQVSLTGQGYEPSSVPPVTGVFTAIGQSAVFAPVAGRSFNVWLPAYTGSIQLECSPDGVSWYILTESGVQLKKWVNPTAAFQEKWETAEVGLFFRLNCTLYVSGSPAYRLSQ